MLKVENLLYSCAYYIHYSNNFTLLSKLTRKDTTNIAHTQAHELFFKKKYQTFAEFKKKA